jgi:hypothetical protein
MEISWKQFRCIFKFIVFKHKSLYIQFNSFLVHTNLKETIDSKSIFVATEPYTHLNSCIIAYISYKHMEMKLERNIGTYGSAETTNERKSKSYHNLRIHAFNSTIDWLIGFRIRIITTQTQMNNNCFNYQKHRRSVSFHSIPTNTYLTQLT